MKIVILRPPMIYGPKSKGNYPLLAKFAGKTPVFPTIKNERSMLFVGNLSLFVKRCIDKELEGIYLPQNEHYVSTCDLVKKIAQNHDHKILFISLFNPFVRLFHSVSAVNKVFGNLIIDPSLSAFSLDYQRYSFDQSIQLTEKGDMAL